MFDEELNGTMVGQQRQQICFRVVVVVPAAVDGWIRVKLSEWRSEGVVDSPSMCGL